MFTELYTSLQITGASAGPATHRSCKGKTCSSVYLRTSSVQDPADPLPRVQRFVASFWLTNTSQVLRWWDSFTSGPHSETRHPHRTVNVAHCWSVPFLFRLPALPTAHAPHCSDEQRPFVLPLFPAKQGFSLSLLNNVWTPPCCYSRRNTWFTNTKYQY